MWEDTHCSPPSPAEHPASEQGPPTASLGPPQAGPLQSPERGHPPRVLGGGREAGGLWEKVGRGGWAEPGRPSRRPQNTAMGWSKSLMCLCGQRCLKPSQKLGEAQGRALNPCLCVCVGGGFKGNPRAERFPKTLAFLADPNGSLPSSSKRGAGKGFPRRPALSHPSSLGPKAAELHSHPHLHKKASLPVPGEVSSRRSPWGGPPQTPECPEFMRRPPS